MCGIAGILNLHRPELIPVETLGQMAAALHHRGPDEAGYYRDSWVGLASARLSIVDLCGGQQPIGDEDGRRWIVYNGEVYNYPELRPELERCGHRLATQTDTEVILHLYEQHGPACLRRLNGQFALAIWDAREHSLFLARDRFGVRPLYYAIYGDQLLFASEIKALLACPGLRLEVDPLALRQAFTYWSVQPPRSIFRGVWEVPPGHYGLVRQGAVKFHAYWAPNLAEAAPRRSDADYADELEHLLTGAARLRLRADVPVGAYLSGGLDSSTVAALVHEAVPGQLETFSIAFTDDGYDERNHQHRMAQHLGTRHHELLCTHADIARVFPDVIWHAETPILRTAPAPMFLLSQLVHDQGLKVVLTGEGADEILAGYDIFKEMQIRRFWARQPESRLRPLLLGRLYPDIPRLGLSESFLTAFFRRDLEQTASPYYSHALRWSNTARTWRFLAGGPPDCDLPNSLPAIPLPPDFTAWSPLGQAQFLELVTFLSPYLLSSQGDRMAMAHSVEGRYPFLDHRLVEFCNRLPANVKLHGLTEKWLLRRMARRLLPPEIWQRRKRAYRAPIQRSFFGPQAEPDYSRELMAPEALRRSGLFQPAAVARLLAKARSSTSLTEIEEMAVAGILSTQLVDHLFVRRQAAMPAAPDLARFKSVDRITP